MDTSAATPPAGISPPQQALWWLKKGAYALGPEWEKAHNICQQQEGTRAYDLVHALAHWIEGDAANRDYWYRRVSPWSRAASIEAEWQQVAETLKR
ncbi:MAG: hypothetical protein LCH46_14520 [Proteobacteria bacterium]|nr:hypothetical protein [Pseudomonadota bacterium]